MGKTVRIVSIAVVVGAMSVAIANTPTFASAQSAAADPTSNPDLGSFAPPAAVRARLEHRGPGNSYKGPVDSADLLATYGSMRVAGVADRDEICWATYDRLALPDLTCTAPELAPSTTLSAVRSFVQAGDVSEAISGMAPAGSASVLLTASDGRSLSVRVYSAGGRWQGRGFYAGAWPTDQLTRVDALDRTGKLLATATSQPLALP
jgi:hypothetical protein